MKSDIHHTTLRIPKPLYGLITDRANEERRSLNSVIIIAIEKGLSQIPKELYFPEEKDLNISASDVESDRKIIAKYEEKIAKFKIKATNSTGSRRGAYEGHVTKTKRNLDGMSGNLAYHLDWLKKYNPDVYEAIK